MAATAQGTRRREILNQIADEQIDTEDSIAADRARAEEAAAAERVKRRQKLDMAREDVQLYVQAVAKIEAGIDMLAEGERARDRVAARLLHVPGLAAFLTKSSWTRRLGDYLSRRLFDTFRLSQLGRIKLNAARNTATLGLAGSEATNLHQIFDHNYGAENEQ